jgi:hypothetical protein
MTLAARIAIEALRAGVPNRAAVLRMGTEETAIEDAFEAVLRDAWSAAPRAGLGIAGGFGTGKSHLLGYFAEVARQQNFVVSRVVISKETPLSDPARLFAAAMRGAVLPDRIDDALASALATLRERPEAIEQLEAAVRDPAQGFAPAFAAMLFLLKKSTTPPDLLRGFERFFGGGKLPGAALRQALRDAGAGRTFDLRAVPTAALMQQQIAFVPRLFRAVGYGGWCLLLDEVELIGRYTPLQRALAYAWLATWLGLEGARPFPGIATAYAITDDFAAAVIEARQDEERLPERLRLKGREQEAGLALAAMAQIERSLAAHRLRLPTEADLAACQEKLRVLYTEAYGWSAPPLPPAERTSTRTMRHHVKAWVTQWDMLRLAGARVAIAAETLAGSYDEDAAFAAPAPEEEPD